MSESHQKVKQRALIVGTSVAISKYKSGASIRLRTISDILRKEGFDVTSVASDDYLGWPDKRWDIIVAVSYGTAKTLSKARAESKFFWFDATDSWHQSRLSRIATGEILQILALCRDLYWLSKVNDFDMITFISKSDAEAEKRYLKKRAARVFVFPNNYTIKKLSRRSQARLVFVGDGRYGPNTKALKFLKKVSRFLGPDHYIHLVGKDIKMNHKQFINLGILSEDVLYQKNDIHLAPIFSGSGIKNKVAEPLAHGLTVVTTTNGANGLKYSDRLIVQRTAEEFANIILKILATPERGNKTPKTSIYKCDDSAELLKILSLLSSLNK